MELDFKKKLIRELGIWADQDKRIHLDLIQLIDETVATIWRQIEREQDDDQLTYFMDYVLSLTEKDNKKEKVVSHSLPCYLHFLTTKQVTTYLNILHFYKI